MKYLHFFLLLFIGTQTFAQDARYYQYDLNTLYLNPALTGERIYAFKGVQLNTNNGFHSTNASRGAGNIVSSIGVDMPLTNRIAIGQFLGNNRSESGSFNTFNFLISGAYKIINPADNDDKTCLSVGLQFGVLNTSMNTQNFTYASQYNPNSATGFDNSYSSGESFTKQSFYTLDNNVGIYYRSNFVKNKLMLATGLSFYHLGSRGNNNTLDKGADLRSNFHINLICHVGKILTLTPKFLYMNQSNVNEYNAGLLLNFKVNKHAEPIVGVNWILQKALVAQIGLKFNENNIFRVSYSSATGSFTTSGSRGMEFSYIHISNRKLQAIKKYEDEYQKEEKHTDPLPQVETNDPEDIYYLLKLKNILSRLTMLVSIENISASDIQRELDKVKDELKELSHVHISAEMSPLVDSYIQQISEKLKVLQEKIKTK
jgi:type IX secretion system PorP/SprF family membrane protein